MIALGFRVNVRVRSLGLGSAATVTARRNTVPLS